MNNTGIVITSMYKKHGIIIDSTMLIRNRRLLNLIERISGIRIDYEVELKWGRYSYNIEVEDYSDSIHGGFSSSCKYNKYGNTHVLLHIILESIVEENSIYKFSSFKYSSSKLEELLADNELLDVTLEWHDYDNYDVRKSNNGGSYGFSVTDKLRCNGVSFQSDPLHETTSEFHSDCYESNFEELLEMGRNPIRNNYEWEKISTKKEIFFD